MARAAAATMERADRAQAVLCKEKDGETVDARAMML
jgi:hypothetical protein